MKERLDKLLVANKITPSREKAKAFIMEGLVTVDGQRADKPGELVSTDSKIKLKEVKRFVSRGGYKLQKAIENQKIDLRGKICLDIGCSTGGFTDCILQNGGKRVYAVDVGYGQLNYNLRTDSRVIVIERTNARFLSKETVKEKIDFLTVDVSFISLKLIIPAVKEFLNENATAILLIKPQFEAGREMVGKNGVVKDKQTHTDVIRSIYNFVLAEEFRPVYVDYSPIKGPKGNIEFLITLTKKKTKPIFDYNKIADVVEKAHCELNNL